MEVESYDEFGDSEDEIMGMASLLLIMRRKTLVETLDSGLDKSFY